MKAWQLKAAAEGRWEPPDAWRPFRLDRFGIWTVDGAVFDEPLHAAAGTVFNLWGADPFDPAFPRELRRQLIHVARLSPRVLIRADTGYCERAKATAAACWPWPRSLEVMSGGRRVEL